MKSTRKRCFRGLNSEQGQKMKAREKKGHVVVREVGQRQGKGERNSEGTEDPHLQGNKAVHSLCGVPAYILQAQGLLRATVAVYSLRARVFKA